MDETSIYLDSPPNYTYASVGTKRVQAATTGNTSTRVSIASTAAASGKKLKMIILIPRKLPLKDFIPPRNAYKSFAAG